MDMEPLRLVASWFLLFAVYSVGGWVIEMVMTAIQEHKLYNRGFLLGPFCPIYGVGAVSISLLLSGVDSPFAIFCVSVVGATLIEYLASYIMEKMFHVRWWDYSEYQFNLNGRVCLLNAALFGVFGLLALYVINPFLFSLFSTWPDLVIYLVSGVIFVLCAMDFFTSCWLIGHARVTAGTKSADATEEIGQNIRKILLSGSAPSRRLAKAYPKRSTRSRK